MRTTSLSQNILLRSIALLLTLLLLGAAAVWAVLSLERQVRNATKEYAELRQIEAGGRSIAVAAGLLRASPPDPRAAAEELGRAITSTAELAHMQEGEPEGSTRHEALESRSINRASSALVQVVDDLLGHSAGLQREPTNWVPQLERLEQVQAEFAQLAREADALVAKTRERTGRGAWNATLAIGVTFLMVSTVAIVISVAQYHSIMRPLRALRDGVRRIARGKFDERLPALGEREFIELTEDFNRMAAELDELYRDLEAKVAAKSRELVQSERLASVGFLAAGVAHEINNPLGIMSGFAELSLKRLRNGSEGGEALEDARRSLQIIRDEAFRCREITEKLLTMSRGGSGDRAAVPVHAVIEDVAAMVAAHPAYRGRRLEVQLPDDDDLVVFGDESELRQVLLNLCVNALEAVSPVVGVVTIRGRRDGRFVEIVVEDNGCGMTPDVLDHVFEPFFSARRTAATPTENGNGAAVRGTGLGLSITRAIIESAGGTIRAASDGIDLGSRFVARFPAALRACETIA